jgi:hypothetical protein
LSHRQLPGASDHPFPRRNSERRAPAQNPAVTRARLPPRRKENQGPSPHRATARPGNPRPSPSKAHRRMAERPAPRTRAPKRSPAGERGVDEPPSGRSLRCASTTTGLSGLACRPMPPPTPDARSAKRPKDQGLKRARLTQPAAARASLLGLLTCPRTVACPGCPPRREPGL